MIPPVQAEIAGFLQALAGRPPIETHISAVFVGPDTVWKLKKAVALPFLDFTRPDTRRRFVLRELELNRPMAPEIYRDAAAIIRDADGRFGFAPADAANALDWVVRMAVIPRANFLDQVAREAGLSPKLCCEIADLVVRMHERAAPAPAAAADSAGRLQKLIDANAAGARLAGLDADAVGRWRGGAAAALAGVWPLLAARAAGGRVRRVHGDLHLGNLCLWRGLPVPFDALEFDEDLATIDTGYDLAFLLMDVDQRAGRAAANLVFNRYIARAGDVEMPALLPLFLSLRAMVRAHVCALADNPEAPGYLDAACGYLRPVVSPVVAIGGLQGTGKSTLARALAPGLGPAPGALVLRTDELRKRLHGVPPERRLPPAAYTPAANARLDAALLAAAQAAAATGHGLILDATFLAASLREGVAGIAAQARRGFLGLWLEAPLPQLEARLDARQGDASDADRAVLRRAAALDPGPITWHRLRAENAEALRARALALIAERAG